MDSNTELVKGVGQGQATQDVTDAYDSKHGTYNDDRNHGGKPNNAGPGTLVNTPSPIKTTGG